MEHHHSTGIINHDQSQASHKVVVLTVLGTLLFFAVTILGTYGFYVSEQSSELDRKETVSGDFQQKKALYHYEEEHLTKSEVPIVTAMDRVVARYATK